VRGGSGSRGRAASSPVGSSPPRADGAEKVTGRALFVDDLPGEGVWYGRTLRSEVAHGTLRRIEADPWLDRNGAVLVTAEDIPGRNEIKLLLGDQPALVPVGGTIRHPEEALALVAAPTREIAAEALAHLRAEVEPLPGIFTIEDALAADVSLWKDDNVFQRHEVHRGEDVDEVLARCATVVEGTYRTATQEQMYIEPQGMIAAFDGDACRIVGSLQCPFYVRAALQRLLALPEEKVIVSQATTGGGFGGKEDYPSVLAAHAALLARKTGRAVKMVYERSEDLACTPKRHPSRVHHRLGLDEDGRIVAVDVDLALDGGAYLTLSPVVLSRAVLHAAGAYRIDNVRVVGRVLATNHPPFGAFRGFGAPQALFACERQVQKAARRAGVDPLEMRRRHALRLGDRTATGQELEHSVGTERVLDAIEETLRSPAPPPPADPLPSAAAADPSRVRRGRGIAFGLHGAGFTGSGEERLAGRAEVVRRSDGSFEVRVGSTDLGQGAHTTLAQIAAAALNVPLERVRVVAPSTELVPDSGPTVASRTCMVVGSVVERAARRLRDAMHDRGEPPGELTRSATYESPPGIRWDDDTYTGSAYPVYGYAACAVDVAVDLDTFEVTVERCVHAVDVGKAIHPQIVEGQIEGGTLQALGWALWEQVHQPEGRVLNRTMSTDVIPTAVEAPEIETVVVEEPYPHGPHGAKGLGEIPMDTPAAAVANALEDALGVSFDELPIPPEVICARLGGEG